MVKRIIKFDNDEPEILERFYNKLRTTITKAYNYKEKEADFEAYRWILQNTSKPPKDYLKIFHCIPETSKKAILRHLGYKSENAFKKSFSKQLNVYCQSIFRREEKDDI